MSVRHQVGSLLLVIGVLSALISLNQDQVALLDEIPAINQLYTGGVAIALPLFSTLVFIAVRSYLFMGDGHERLGVYASPLTFGYIVSWLVYLFTLNNGDLVLVPYVVFLILFVLLYWVAKKSFVVVDRAAMVLGLLFAILYLPLLILATNIFVE